MRSLQLIPLIVHLALSVPRLLPGAIVHQHGTTACVEDSIMVKLRISPTSLLEPISKLQNDIQEIQNNINRQIPNNTHQNYETSQILYHNVNSLQSKLNKIKYTIYHLPDPDNDTINTRRTKRGLFDFVGIISKSLFGTATDQDIHTVDTHIGKITRVLQQQGKLIDLNSQNIDLLADSVNSVIDKYNYLAQFTNTQLSQITNSQTALFFLYHLNNLDKELDSLKDHTNLIQKDIWNAHAGVVDSQMITPTQLTQTLRRAHSTLQLTPFFSKHEIQHYYPILASTIFQQFILINIPMDPVKRFSLWEIYPFPYPYQNRTMTLNLPTSTILKSTDGQWLTLTSPDTITTCKTARPNFHICPAYPFHFQLTKSRLHSKRDSQMWVTRQKSPTSVRQVIEVLEGPFFDVPEASRIRSNEFDANNKDANVEDANNKNVNDEDANNRDANDEDANNKDVNDEDANSKDANDEDANDEDANDEDANDEDANDEDANNEDANEEE
ncbi:uncharacterized protein LOC143038354 [Oratosquilla oratoria]|uniref:uncharacterized protein LOC143038354 n=1 Tax=Oratosquilla oratoria TaxID=337810 RepID=UPI003F759BF0